MRLRQAMELTRVLTLVLAVAVGVVIADEDLAIGQPFVQSSQVNLPQSCTAPTNLAVSANVSGLSPDNCTCTQTSGFSPPEERDWVVLRIQSQSLVRAVRISGHIGLLDVLVGDHFEVAADLDKFSLCTSYSSADGILLPCMQPVIGGFVALRASGVLSSIRVCSVQVMGQSGNLLKTGSQLNWTLVPEPSVDQQWRLVDGDESTCVDFNASQATPSDVSLRLKLLQAISNELRVKVVFRGVPSGAVPPPSAAAAVGRVCSLVRSDSSSVQVVCTCRQQCRGTLSIGLLSIQPGNTLQLCEVIATADESAVIRACDECKGPVVPVGLGDADGRFEDESWTASSSSTAGQGSCTAPSLARLNHATPDASQEASAWCAADVLHSWISVDLGTLFKIRAVVVQGGGTASFGGAFVTSFGVDYALGSSDWIPYTEGGAVKVFPGPSHPSIPVLRSFESDVVASRIRITALSWNIRPCLRFEVIGCRLHSEEWSSSIHQALSGPFGIPNSRLQSSSNYAIYYPNEKSRLGSIIQCSMRGSWSPANNDADQWIQFDLGETRTVHGAYWRGRAGYAQFVTTYFLQYARTGGDPLTSYLSTALETGIFDQTTIIYNDMLRPFDAQVIRVIPNAFFDHKSIRMDFHVAPRNPTIITAPGASADDRYTALSGQGFYRYINQPLTSSQAEVYCAGEGAHLVQVTSVDEWNAIKAWIPQSNPKDVYMEHKGRGQTGLYLGCFADFDPRDLSGRKTTPTDITVEKCEETCLKQDMTKYLGLQYNMECYCGDRAGLYGRLSEDNCNMPCAGNPSVMCGSSWRNSVYSRGSWMFNPHVEWTSKGCYTSGGPSIVISRSMTSSSMSIEGCVSFCLAGGFFRFVGLQTSNTCICIDSILPAATSVSAGCSSPCGGDPSQICGGGGSSSVYEISYRSDSCVLIGGQNGPPPGVPLKFAVSTPSALCLDQQTNYNVASIPVNETRHFICKKDGLPPAQPITAPVVTAQGLYRYVNQSRTYEQAAAYCASMGELLAQVTSYAEWTALRSLIPQSNPVDVYMEHKGRGQTGLYKGCYIDSGNRDFTGGSIWNVNLTVEMCDDICLKQRMTKYLGLQNGQECYCGDRAGQYGRTAESDCNAPCGGNSTEKCGGGWRNSVYSRGNWMFSPHVEWTSKGCYAAGSQSLLVSRSTTSISMSVEACISFCLSTGFARYIGLQAQNVCSCIDSVLSPATLTSTNCSSPCSGDPAQNCGGAVASSVYEISYRGESCVWIDGQSGPPPGVPFTSTVNSPSAFCLDQRTNYGMAALPMNETRHFICKKGPGIVPPPRLLGLWPLSAYHGFRDVSSNRQHGQSGLAVSNTQGLFKTEKTSVVHHNGATSFVNTIDSFVDIPVRWDLSYLSAFTVVLGVFPTDSGSVLTFSSSSLAALSVSFSRDSSTLTVSLARQRDQLVTTASVPVSLGTWNVLAVTYSVARGTGLVYVNNVLQASIPVGSGEQLMSSSSLRLGSVDAVRRSFQGRLRCLQLYDRELLSFELTTAPKRCSPSTSQGLLGLWPLSGDLQNYVHPSLPASSAQRQFVAGPRLRLNSRVRALKTNGTSSTAVSIGGPLNVSGSSTVMLHVKSNATTGTLLQMQGQSGSVVITVAMAGSNIVVATLSSQLLQGVCSINQGTHVALRLDAAAMSLSILCNGSVVNSRAMAAAEVTALQSFSSMLLAPNVVASLSCLVLFERALTDLEVASHRQYCPFRGDDVYGRRSTPKRHCGEWLKSGYLKSDTYIVDPDGAEGPVEPFTVFCNMTDSFFSLRGATVVRHFMPSAVNASQMATRQIGYEAGMEQIQALLALSVYCRQAISFACVNSAFNQGSTQVVRWHSRDGVPQTGWAGSSTGCPCSLQGQCAGGQSARCNCDMNDATQREDGGWITDKSLLPVSAVSTTVASLRGLVTVGDLVCFA